MSNERRYLESCYLASENLTKKFSTSFSLGIFCLDKRIRKYVYAIYGLVRVGDEIVDTFFDVDQRSELDLFEAQAIDSIKNKYSSNMVLHAFQDVVNKFNITENLIKSFFESIDINSSILYGYFEEELILRCFLIVKNAPTMPAKYPNPINLFLFLSFNNS